MPGDNNPTAELRRLARDAVDINVLRAASGHPELAGMTLTDAAADQILRDIVGRAFRQSLNKPSALYGIIAQQMFASMVASLGQVQLIKEEDIGEAFSADEIVVPDYFVVLRDGTRVLIEVKSFNENPAKHE